MRAKRGGQGSWVLSILLHLVIVGAIAGIWYWMAHRSKPVETLGIEARVVSGAALTPPPAPQPEPDAVPVPEEQPPDPPPEAPPAETGPTPEELAAQAAEEKRVADEKHVAEERRLAAEREVADRKAADEKADRDRKDKAKADKAKADKEKADREKAEREKAAKDKAEKDKADAAERDRLAREKAEKDKLEQARKQREDELSAQLAAEDQRAAARNSAAMAQYVGQIASRIERAWNRPPNVKPGIECELHVTQVPGGAVTSVKVGRCNADEATRQSIEAAAYRASPLPTPPDPALFERDLVVTFRPE
ncbi:MAG: cell envelope integrity protein TolA [Pseudomonadota bacterium]